MSRRDTRTLSRRDSRVSHAAPFPSLPFPSQVPVLTYVPALQEPELADDDDDESLTK